MKPNYAVVLFDFDGTIADTRRDVWESIAYACVQCGLQLPDRVREDSTKLALGVPQLYRLLAGYSDGKAEAVFGECIRRHYRFENPFPHTVLYPGMEELLTALSGCAELHVASNKSQEALDRLLEIKGWQHWFQSVLGMQEGLDKTEMIRRILSKYSALPKEKAVFIGDTYTDVLAARENGIAAVGVTYGDGDPARLLAQAPECRADSCRELFAVLLRGEK